MKNLLFITTLLFGLLLFSCGAESNHTTEGNQSSTLYVLLDYTEGQEYNFTLTDLINKSGMPSSIVIQPIRDLSFSESETINFTFEDHSGNDFVKRNKEKKAIKDGQVKLKSIVDNMNSTYSGKELKYSSIVSPLADVIDLATPNDVVILFSDMLENTKDINYRKSTKDAIMTDLQSRIVDNKLRVMAVVKPFRPTDDRIMRETLKVWKIFFKNTSITFNHYNNI